MVRWLNGSRAPCNIYLSVRCVKVVSGPLLRPDGRFSVALEDTVPTWADTTTECYRAAGLLLAVEILVRKIRHTPATKSGLCRATICVQVNRKFGRGSCKGSRSRREHGLINIRPLNSGRSNHCNMYEWGSRIPRHSKTDAASLLYKTAWK